MSILSDPVIVKSLQTQFIPVAVDQHDHRRRKDAEGELFAAILKQAGRGLDGYSQGFYIFTPAGKLLAFENTLSGERVKAMMTAALKKFDATAPLPKFEETPKEGRLLYHAPEGSLVLSVNAKVLGSHEAKAGGVPRDALGNDHLWVRKDEAAELAKGVVPRSLQIRIARFHLVDNTRGEPPFWKEDEIRRLEMTLDKGKLTGSVHLETKAGDRGFDARFFGIVAADDGKVARFDLVAKGEFWGEGTFSRGAPKGRFPFAVAFRLTEEESERVIPPGGARGNVKGYLR